MNRRPRLTSGLHSTLALLVLGLLASATHAQQSERFDDYELHYSVVNTTFLAPEVAARYGITRGRRQAIVNIAVRHHGEGVADGEAKTVPVSLEGRTWDLIAEQPLRFIEIDEGDAVYYIGEFQFINREWRWFEISFQPEGAGRSYTHKFKHQLYIH
jgi:hypothetical protein